MFSWNETPLKENCPDCWEAHWLMEMVQKWELGGLVWSLAVHFFMAAPKEQSRLAVEAWNRPIRWMFCWDPGQELLLVQGRTRCWVLVRNNNIFQLQLGWSLLGKVKFSKKLILCSCKIVSPLPAQVSQGFKILEGQGLEMQIELIF